AAFLLVTDLNLRTKNVGAVNTLTVRELERNPSRADDAAGLSAYYASYYFPRGFGGVRTYFFDANGQPETSASRRFGPLSPWLVKSDPRGEGFVGLIATRTGYAVASYGSTSGAKPERVLTLYRLGRTNLDSLAKAEGQVSLGRSGYVDLDSSGAAAAGQAPPALASTRPLPAASSLFDIHITSLAFIPVTEWATGKGRTVLATINTRPSLLNDQLFASFQSSSDAPLQVTRWPLLLLGVIAVGFLIIETFAFFAGVRLTRTITGTVNDLYVGTEHVNRGDFDHRISVRTRDQLAALAISFNNMTGSIQRLLVEQRQKQQLEGELSIAHEVQTQLFPRLPPVAAGLEIQGRCLPARVVSGDYYDFQQLSPDRVCLALGDISGKGISAALLMATIVAAVRAYQPGTAELALPAAAGGGGAAGHADGNGDGNGDGDPARLIARLNRQLYFSTPPEKYATLFYAIYDRQRRELRYTNAGHLPPVVLGAHGRRRLDRGGMVVGLFEEASFEDSVIALEPGDLLAAWSDGVTEPENEYGVEFGEARLLQILEANRQRPLSDIISNVLSAVAEWTATGTDGAGEQADDITLLLARPI
ncbi:MAG: PP2C family protein-serine/threonine phosphatase, partial [Terriglobales bacterium]